MSGNPMNLVVFLARAGAGSRRSCDELVRSGAVAVNGETVTFPRHKIGRGTPSRSTATPSPFGPCATSS